MIFRILGGFILASYVMSEMTKRLLADSIKKSLSKKAFKKITVKDIVSECNLTRQTFYYHFQDVYDLVDWMFSDIIKGLLKDSSENSRKQNYKNILIYISENRNFFLSTLNHMGYEYLKNAIYPPFFEYNKSYILKLSLDSEKKIAEKKIDFLANLQTLSLISFLINWIDISMKQDLNQIDDITEMLGASLDLPILSILNSYEAIN